MNQAYLQWLTRYWLSNISKSKGRQNTKKPLKNLMKQWQQSKTSYFPSGIDKVFRFLQDDDCWWWKVMKKDDDFIHLFTIDWYSLSELKKELRQRQPSWFFSEQLVPKNLRLKCYPPTKYLHIESTTVYVPSLELGLPHPFSLKRVCPPPRTKGWGGTLACG